MPIDSMDAEVWEQADKIDNNVKHEMGIKEDKLLVLLKQAGASKSSTGGALRTVEICKLMGWSDKRVRRQLGILKAQGFIEVVTIQINSVDDIVRPAKAYRILETNDG